MKFINIGLKQFDSDELEVYVVAKDNDGKTTDVKLSALFEALMKLVDK